MTQGAIDLVQAELGQTRLLKNSLQKRIDIKIKTVEGCQRKLPAVIMSDGISQRKVDDLSHSKVGVVDLTQIVPSDGKPDLNTLRKYIRRNRS